ncbi:MULTISPECIES: FAD-binding oxidoreductase [unclassified Mesorhizobium]|uniref:NAD(P)/FAD-dependent oxidoreductase n=1 Tax=unclassified Mesorhizobium TaxID=325217 RepID=UPI000F764BCE|nr:MULTISPECIES: FAD-binding oxidoreductase [unclassified Mesorhizobium]AZO05048.1 FAD-binding oxidoreductase [Mesorhizobium sp. M2A.F.Ca.ET.043.02.1.1]RWB42984.1 MAG: FAD-binding oxidoreductase [Mesorhizobium sp.]RWB55488.1 MAG: FAD-binding oxidoreductase [Mesorhizobium sp.]RWB88052.1 MAG: FAD-binding oxidoreductase [Mesorhizobium sp.]TIU72865.1 MAG: FAD-binding oxidoreductase [Mesorhizobium sp.]
MRAPLQQIETSGELPQSADAVIIGGGIVGVFAAYYLALRGMKVALVEKGRIGAEQSSRNWGWCRQQNRDARELPMATHSLDLWERFSIETGEDPGFRRCGLLYLSNDEAELARWARWRDFAKTAGVTTHMLDSAEASERGSAMGRTWKGGVFSPTDGTADPSRAAPTVVRAILKLGSTVHQNCTARGIETEGGRLSCVVTESGTIRTKVAVMAGGAWASSFCRQFGFRFPQASIRSSILSVSPGAEGLPDALHTARISVTRRSDGGYTLAISGRGRVDVTPQQLRFSSQFLPMFLKRWRSLAPGGLQGMRSGHETLKRWRLDRPTPMERMRILDPVPDQATIRLTHARALELMPDLRKTRISAAWAGYIDSTPDGVPAIGEINSVPGLFLAAGFSGHGFGIGPGAGHLVADLVTGAEPIVDPTSYDPRRFDASSWGKVADF